MAWRAGGGARDVERGSLATGPKASPSPRWPLRFSLSVSGQVQRTTVSELGIWNCWIGLGVQLGRAVPAVRLDL